MEDAYTMREVAIMTGLHKNTIRNWVKAGLLKATLIDEGTGRQRYVIGRDDLYKTNIPTLIAHLGPSDVHTRVAKAEAERVPGADTVGEIMRLTRELQNTSEELGGLRVKVPMLEAAKEERDKLREEAGRLKIELELSKAALEEARSNARWTWRRKMAKTAGKP